MMASISGSPDRDRFFLNQPLSIASYTNNMESVTGKKMPETAPWAALMMASIAGSPDRDRFFLNQPLSIASCMINHRIDWYQS